VRLTNIIVKLSEEAMVALLSKTSKLALALAVWLDFVVFTSINGDFLVVESTSIPIPVRPDIKVVLGYSY
jgi:hypothetical protein